MAFDWIESHRGLRDHPKTVLLAAAWADRKTCVIGHLHELWWWTLEYAPDGVIRPAFYPQLLIACEWHGKPEKFWEGLLQVGFLDALADGYVVHDWEEYALRRLTRLKKDAVRKRDVRAEIAGLSGPQPQDRPPMSGAKAPDKPPMSGGVSAGQPPPVLPDTSGTHATRGRDQPTDRPDSRGSEKPLLSTPDLPPSQPADADAQGAPPTASARNPTPRELGTNPRAVGTNPRANGTNPRALGTNPRAQEELLPKWEEIAPGQHRGRPNGVGEISLLTARCPRCERSMPVAEVENHECVLVPGQPVETPPKRRRGGHGLHRVFDPPEDIPPEVLADLERMERERPTQEQIAAEVARIGQQPR